MNVLIEKRSHLLAEAQRLALGEKTAENRAKLNTMLADVEAIEADIATEQRLEALVATSNTATTEAIRQNPSAGITGSTENRKDSERKALLEYVRTGNVSAENRQFAKFVHAAGDVNETRDIGTVVGGAITGNGGLYVPQSFDGLLHESLLSFGDIAAEVRQYNTNSGSPIKIAGFDPTAVLFSEILEDVAVSENDPVISGAMSSTSVLSGGKILISLAELTDSAFNLEEKVRDTFAQAYWRSISNFVVNGSTSGNYASLLSSITNTVTGSVAGGLSYGWSDFTSMLGAIEPSYLKASKFAFNNVVRSKILGMVDSNGRPLLNINAASIDGVDTLLGRPVVYVPQLPNAAASASGTVLLADFQSTYTLRSVNGSFGIIRLDQRWMDQLMVGFVAFARGGGYANPLNGAKTAVKLVQHS